MPITIKRQRTAKSPKLKVGGKAGLTRSSIASRAVELIDGYRVGLAPIAASFNVTPAAIRTHFKGGADEIITEMVRRALATVGRPPRPNQGWEAYVRGLFADLLSALRDRRQLAVFVGSELSSDYYLNARLPEHILFALSDAGLRPKQRAQALDLVMGGLIGFAAIEFPHFGGETAAEWTKRTGERLDHLDEGEFPQIDEVDAELRQRAAERAAQAEVSEPSATRARLFADAVIAGIKQLREQRR
jgi:hypothetical protein